MHEEFANTALGLYDLSVTRWRSMKTIVAVLLIALPLVASAHYAHFYQRPGPGPTPENYKPMPIAIETGGALGLFVMNGNNCIATDSVDGDVTNMGPYEGQTICRMALKNRMGSTFPGDQPGTCAVGTNNTYTCTGDVSLAACSVQGTASTNYRVVCP